MITEQVLRYNLSSPYEGVINYKLEEHDGPGVPVLLGEFALHVLDCRLEEEYN